MKISVESTTKIVHLNGVPARVWEGQTESGIHCHCFITRIAAAKDADLSQFERELQEQRAPSPVIAATYPARMVLALCLLLLPTLAFTQTPPPPWRVAFTPSPDHSVIDSNGNPVVVRYELFVSTGGKVVVSAFNLGKPTPDGTNTITVDINSVIAPLPAGTYTVIVDAVSQTGFAPGASVPSPPFTTAGPPTPPRAASPPTAVTIIRQ